MTKTIFLCIPHYVFTSDLLRTKYIEYLSEKYQVVVFTSMIGPEEAKRENYFSSSNVTYIKWHLENPKFWSVFKFLRIALIGEFDYLASMKYFYRRPNYVNNWKRRMLRNIFWPITKILKASWFTAIEYWLLPKSEKFLSYIKEYQPSLLVTATPGFDAAESELILLAKKSKIPSVAVNFTWDNLTMNCKHIRKTDYLVAWNEIMRKEAINIHHYQSEQVFVSGTPRFDPYFVMEKNEPTREEFLKSKGLNPNYPTIFHTTVTRAYTFQKKYIQDLINLRNEKKIPYVNLFFRAHPLDDLETYKEFFGLKDVHFEGAGREIVGPDGKKKVEMSYQDLLNLKYSLKYTDVNVNYASTITIEACIFDKPVINIGYLGVYTFAYGFTHYEPIYKSGAVRLVKKDEELAEFINMYLKDPSIDCAARQKIVSDYVKFTDGLSYKRSVDYLEVIANIKN